jgi:uncharacterized membrane protein
MSLLRTWQEPASTSLHSTTQYLPAWSLVCVAMLICAALRFPSITARNIFQDEILSLAISTGHNWNDTVEHSTTPKVSFYRTFLSLEPDYFGQRLLTLMRSDTQMPLYYFLLTPWVHLFGSSEAALRSLSVLISMGVIPLLYLLGRRLFSPAVGLYSAFIFALAPFQLANAQNARPYPLLLFLALLSTLCALRLAQGEQRWRWFLAYAATAVLGFYTHYLFVCNLLFHGLMVTFYQRHNRAFLYRWAWTLLGVVATLLLWTPILLDQLQLNRKASTLHWIYYYSGRLSLVQEIRSLVRTLLLFLSVGQIQGACIGGSSGAPCPLDRVLTGVFHGVSLLIYGVCAWRLVRARPWVAPPQQPSRWAWGMCLLWVLCIFGPPLAIDLVAGTHMIKTSYYFIAASLPLYVVVALALATLPTRSQRWVASAAVLLFLLMGNVVYLNGLAKKKNFIYEQGFRELAGYLDRSSTAADLTLTKQPNQIPLSLSYNLRSDLDLDTVLDNTFSWHSAEAVAERLEQLTAGRTRVWFIDDRGLEFPAILDWFHMHYDKLQVKTFEGLDLFLSSRQ